jgi:glutamate-1-semialdehyde 2,1-aminomutase
MRHLAPEGGVYQAGTLSGNAAAMSAGLTTLRLLERVDGWTRLEATGSLLEAMLAPVVAAAPFPVRLIRMGSLFWLSLQSGEPPRSAAAIDVRVAARYGPVFHALLDRGVALAPSAYEVGFLSLAHQLVHIARLRDALAEAFALSSESA